MSHKDLVSEPLRSNHQTLVVASLSTVASDDMDVGPGFAGGGDGEEDGFFDPVIEAAERRSSIIECDGEDPDSDDDAPPLEEDGTAGNVVPSAAAADAAHALVVGRYLEGTLTADDKKGLAAAYTRATASPIEIPARSRSYTDDPMAHYQQADLDDSLRAVMHCTTFDEMRPVLDRFKASFRTHHPYKLLFMYVLQARVSEVPCCTACMCAHTRDRSGGRLVHDAM